MAAAVSSFMCGVCEGFYGKPWTSSQRQELFGRMCRFGMTTYLYAPKDDYKHRLYWRKLYSNEEAEELRTIISAAQKNNIDFVYAISPGLDMAFSDKKDVDSLKSKLEQVQSFGCDNFALLFDDIDDDLCVEDEEVYDSAGHAQAALANMLYMHLGQPKVFLFCPTEYCNSRAEPDLYSSQYLKTIGEVLDKGIGIMWTGTKVVPRRMTLETIIEVKEVLKRRPVIWENLHANDYDQTRVYLGPYAGRPHELVSHLSGVLTNPNCEFHANFVAMHTLAQWAHNTVTQFPANGEKASSPMSSATSDSEADMDTTDAGATYQPYKALRCAVRDWIPEFYKPRGLSKDAPPPQQMESSSEDDGEDNEDEKKKQASACAGKTGVCAGLSSSTKDSRKGRDNDEDDENKMDVTPTTARASSAKKEKMRKKMEDIGVLTEEDVLLLSDLHHLPFEHGPRGVSLLKQAAWLIDNVDRLQEKGGGETLLSEKVREWYDRATNFHIVFKDVAVMVDKFVNIPNRELLYELYHYVSDIRSVLSLVNSYIKWNGLDRPNKEPFRGGEPEPWTMRGGLHAEFRRLLPLEGQHDLFPLKNKFSIPSKMVTFRPYFPEDKDGVYLVCRRTCDNCRDGSNLFPDYPDLVADDSIGGLLLSFPDLCYVVEEEEAGVIGGGVTGYAACCLNIRDYQAALVQTWLPEMRVKYPDPCPDKTAQLTPQEEAIKTFYNEPCPIPEEMEALYPSFMHIRLLNWSTSSSTSSPSSPSVLSSSHKDTATRLFSCVAKALKARGSTGVHTAVHTSHDIIIELYAHLGFKDVTNRKLVPDELLLLGKSI